ncbi:MAG: hypothetical protein ABSD75_21625 [Terriglobales bacterium]|jgi:hypothetical protein
MSNPTQSTNTSCAECWQDFANEAALLEHIRAQHLAAFALPPYAIEIETKPNPRCLVAA